MASQPDITSICESIRANYSPCDVSDALLKVGVPGAGFLPDISPIPSPHSPTNRLVAPISTVLFVSISPSPSTSSNIPPNTHFTDCPPPGTVVIMQQPASQTVALLGDIVATRLKTRGVLGAIIDGRSRDIVSCAALCHESAESNSSPFQIWSKALSSVGTSLQAKPWQVDVPLGIGGITVNPGDILVADQGERVMCVIPKEKLDEVIALLPVLKEADDGLLEDVRSGVDMKTAAGRHPKHYANH